MVQAIIVRWAYVTVYVLLMVRHKPVLFHIYETACVVVDRQRRACYREKLSDT